MMIRAEEAKSLLGFGPDSSPSPSQVKAAYKSKAWETHPDRFPPHKKSTAEHQFKLISEAYSCLRSVGNPSLSGSSYSTVVRRSGGVPAPNAGAGRGNSSLVRLPFLFIILTTITLGGLNAIRAYKRQKEAYPSHNPFLP